MSGELVRKVRKSIEFVGGAAAWIIFVWTPGTSRGFWLLLGLIVFVLVLGAFMSRYAESTDEHSVQGRSADKHIREGGDGDVENRSSSSK